MEDQKREGATVIELPTGARVDEPEEAAEPGAAMDALDDAAVEELGGDAQLVQMPIAELVLNGANLRVLEDPESKDRALVVGPIALHLVLPFTQDGARELSRNLAGGIEIVSGLPDGLAKGIAARSTFPGGAGLGGR